jgi:lipopolysaccharide biosynthesis regulator YciM
MSDVQTDWETVSDPATVKRARENYDKTIEAFNAIIRFQELYIKPLISQLDSELAEVASTAKVKKGTNKMGVENTPFASKTFNLVRQIILMSKVEEAADMAIEEFKAGRKPLIALDNTMEGFMNEAFAGLDSDGAEEPDFSLVFKKGLDGVFRMTRKDNIREEKWLRKGADEDRRLPTQRTRWHCATWPAWS